MPPIVIMLVFGTLGLIAVWAIRRDLRDGVSSDSIYRFRADTNPFGYALLIVGKMAVVALCVAFILEAAGYPGPIAMVRGLFGK
jgi:hypothetical protein